MHIETDNIVASLNLKDIKYICLKKMQYLKPFNGMQTNGL